MIKDPNSLREDPQKEGFIRATFSKLFRQRAEPESLGLGAPEILYCQTNFYRYNNIHQIISDKVKRINEYRKMAYYPEVAEAIDTIIDESIISDDDGRVVELQIIDENVKENTQEVIQAEFNNLIRIIDFDNIADELFKIFYTEGELFPEIMIDDAKPEAGVRGVKFLPNETMAVEYNEKGEVQAYIQKIDGMREEIRLEPEQVAYINSGLYGKTFNEVFSFLERALIPYRNLKHMEDALVIYRLVRAPERRIWKVDVGKMPTGKISAFMKEMMRNSNQRTVYNPNTGDVDHSNNVMAMHEDIWLPQRAEGPGNTEIDTLAGGENLDQIADVEYFLRKLYKALKIPESRSSREDNVMFVNNITDMERKEVKFSKYISKLRRRFIAFLTEIFMVHLQLKGLRTQFGINERTFVIRFNENNDYAENKEIEKWERRLGMYGMAEPYIGKVFSNEFAVKTFLRMADEEILENKVQIKKEAAADIDGGFNNEPPDDEQDLSDEDEDF